jgi:NADH:ubiquinone oxidoreductase subunit B-like Fe-S oxidoreductase
MRRNDTLHRRPPRREPLPRVLIVCEGKCTEKGYFEFLRHDERIPIDLYVKGGGTPKSLVERAVRLNLKTAAIRWLEQRSS